MRPFLVVLLTASFVTPAVVAQIPEKILIPVWSDGESGGAFGSRWVTELSVMSKGAAQIAGLRALPCNITCTPAGLPAQQTFRSAPLVTHSPAGVVLDYSPPPSGPETRLQLRVRDLSRQAENWGVEVPVIRERNAISTSIDLLDIPLEPAFRHNLRIYNFRPTPSDEVVVRLYAYVPHEWDIDPPSGVSVYVADRLVHEERLRFSENAGDPSFSMGYAERNFVGDMASFRVGERLRVEIQPGREGIKLWAFLTITNNVTQQVTIVSPQSY